MKINIITLFPEMFRAITDFGISGKASHNGIVDITFTNPRDFTKDRHRTVDDRPYGGGPGMVLMAAPLREAIRDARLHASKDVRVIYLSPQGRRLDQRALRKFSHKQELIFVCGRYEGIDERVITAEVDEEWSIGDYVLSGGEVPAMVIIDGIIRLLPDALGHADSAGLDSFSQDFMGGLLDYPQFTRPEELDGEIVPNVLLSGNHQAILRWRQKQALGRTWLRRPDLLQDLDLDHEQQLLLSEFIHENDE
ncbi:MAG: tRNA (guanosine(37)-N1)-methyltransferase TrmD [Thiohalomonadales bacterium]